MNERAASTRLLEALRRIGQALDNGNYPWALVGGLAVSVRVEPRWQGTRAHKQVVLTISSVDAGVVLKDAIACGLVVSLLSCASSPGSAHQAGVDASPPNCIGVATMEADGTIVLQLRAVEGGAVAGSQLTCTIASTSRHC